jgi:hypothetical protein
LPLGGNSTVVNNYQIIYHILIKPQSGNSIKGVQALPGADTDSDHTLILANICTRLKKIIGSIKENQDGIWGCYLLDRKCKML